MTLKDYANLQVEYHTFAQKYKDTLRETRKALEDLPCPPQDKLRPATLSDIKVGAILWCPENKGHRMWTVIDNVEITTTNIRFSSEGSYHTLEGEFVEIEDGLKDFISIDVVKAFSKYPGGEFLTDGPSSGEAFRERILLPALREYKVVRLEMDGTLGYGSSFLRGAFMPLCKALGEEPEHLVGRLHCNIASPNTHTTIFQMIYAGK